MVTRNILILVLALASMSVRGQVTSGDADTQYATQLLQPGMTVPNFKLTDNYGKKKQLAKLIKGKYTVLDFWASWCPDCRKDFPNIQRIRQTFEPMGVQFIGISFDNDAGKWRNAISQYQLNYTQVSDLVTMRDSEVAKTFGVKWIPSMILIGKDGKVILSTVLSDKLEKKLAEVMAKE